MLVTQEKALIYWDGVEDVMIKVPDSFKSKAGSNHRLYGLCGTFDGDKSNDFTGIGSTTSLQNINDFSAAGMAFDDKCKETSLAAPSYYAPDGNQQAAVTYAEKLCSVIETDMFAPCFQKIPVGGYKAMCMKDVLHCNYNKRSDCICNSLALYARSCELNANITLTWRSSSVCRKFHLPIAFTLRLFHIHAYS